MKLGDAELESIASDGDIKVPEGLDSEVRTALDRERGRRRPSMVLLSAVCSAAAAVAACFIILNHRQNALYAEPQDSFDDPYEAYACLQSAFGKIGATMDSALEYSAPVIENGVQRTAEVFMSCRP